MKKQLYLCLFVLSSISLFAQVQQGGTPYSSSHILPDYAQEVIHFPIQKVTCLDNQLVIGFGQQIGNKICKIDGK